MITEEIEKGNNQYILLTKLIDGLLRLEDLFSYDDVTMPLSVKIESITLARRQIGDLLPPEIMKVYYDDVKKDYLEFYKEEKQLQLLKD